MIPSYLLCFGAFLFDVVVRENTGLVLFVCLFKTFLLGLGGNMALGSLGWRMMEDKVHLDRFIGP